MNAVFSFFIIGNVVFIGAVFLSVYFIVPLYFINVSIAVKIDIVAVVAYKPLLDIRRNTINFKTFIISKTHLGIDQ